MAAVPPVWISNPFSAPPLFWLEYEFGRLLLLGWGEPGARERFHEFVTLVRHGTSGHGFLEATHMVVKSLLELGAAVIVPLMAGGLVLGVVLAVPSYFVTVKTVRAVRDRRRVKRARYLRETEPEAAVESASGHDDPVEE